MKTPRHLAAIGLLLVGAVPVLAQPPLPTAVAPGGWVYRPQDWGSKGPILLPPDRNTPTYISDPTPSRPAQPPTPNYYQFSGYDQHGRPMFANPTTGQARVVPSNSQGTLGFRTTYGEVQRMNAARPVGQAAPGVPSRRP